MKGKEIKILETTGKESRKKGNIVLDMETYVDTNTSTIYANWAI